MSGIDFTSALAQLLRDGSLRDAFAASPSATADRLDVRAGDRSSVVTLIHRDLEFQAEVLLRKRFGEIRRLLPMTCARLNDKAWHYFRNYSRQHWPARSPLALWDALSFCKYLAENGSRTVSQCEANRVVFALGSRRFGVHLVEDAMIRGRVRDGLQVLFRSKTNQWHEVFLFLSF